MLQLCCNQLTGSIPTEMGFLKKLTLLALESNRLTGQIPASLGNLMMLKRLYLSFNQLSGLIPVRLANIPQLEHLEVQNNTLSGVVPSGELVFSVYTLQIPFMYLFLCSLFFFSVKSPSALMILMFFSFLPFDLSLILATDGMKICGG